MSGRPRSEQGPALPVVSEALPNDTGVVFMIAINMSERGRSVCGVWCVCICVGVYVSISVYVCAQICVDVHVYV